VIHHATPDFWSRYKWLPENIRRVADRCFEQLKADGRHPSLQLKKIGKVWSARVGLEYRVLGFDVKNGIVWFWIGTHAEYERLIG
jgi:hypothetical protein